MGKEGDARRSTKIKGYGERNVMDGKRDGINVSSIMISVMITYLHWLFFPFKFSD